MNILVYIEERGGVVKKASLESLSKAKELGGSVAAVVIGSGVDGTIDKIKAYGAEKVFVFDNADLANYVAEGYLAGVQEAANQFGAEAIFMAATSRGRDLSPRVAAKMGIMLIPDVTAVELNDGNLDTKRPVYAGKVYMGLRAKELPVVISTRPNTFDAVEAAGAGERVDIAPAYEAKTRVVELIASDSGSLDVAEADRVVAGGRGMKDAESFKLLEDLAAKLGAAVGSTRAVVDADWRPHSEQVGQTGKTVSPTLYFAIGISGAVQHIVGMRTSKIIVAVNKDADAPIFKVADYGIVGDALTVVPALIDAL